MEKQIASRKAMLSKYLQGVCSNPRLCNTAEFLSFLDVHESPLAFLLPTSARSKLAPEFVSLRRRKRLIGECLQQERADFQKGPEAGVDEESDSFVKVGSPHAQVTVFGSEGRSWFSNRLRNIEELHNDLHELRLLGDEYITLIRSGLGARDRPRSMSHLQRIDPRTSPYVFSVLPGGLMLLRPEYESPFQDLDQVLGLLDQEATSLSSSRPDGALSAGKTSMTGAHESALDLVSSTVASLSLRERKHSGNRNLTPPSSSGVEELEMIPSPETWAEPACVSAMDISLKSMMSFWSFQPRVTRRAFIEYLEAPTPKMCFFTDQIRSLKVRPLVEHLEGGNPGALHRAHYTSSSSSGESKPLPSAVPNTGASGVVGHGATMTASHALEVRIEWSSTSGASRPVKSPATSVSGGGTSEEKVSKKPPNNLLVLHTTEGVDMVDTLQAKIKDVRTRAIHVLNVLRELHHLRCTSYDKSNPSHEELLMRLWDQCATDGEKLTSRVTDQWQKIGFQGNDPSTDFRGMGLLGLHQLLYFSANFPDSCRSIVACPDRYPFAVACINVTSLLVRKAALGEASLGSMTAGKSSISGTDAVQLLSSNPVFAFILRGSEYHNVDEIFHQMHCALFQCLQQTYVDSGAGYMDFPEIMRIVDEKFTLALDCFNSAHQIPVFSLPALRMEFRLFPHPSSLRKLESNQFADERFSFDVPLESPQELSSIHSSGMADMVGRGPCAGGGASESPVLSSQDDADVALRTAEDMSRGSHSELDPTNSSLKEDSTTRSQVTFPHEYLDSASASESGSDLSVGEKDVEDEDEEVITEEGDEEAGRGGDNKGLEYFGTGMTPPDSPFTPVPATSSSPPQHQHALESLASEEMVSPSPLDSSAPLAHVPAPPDEASPT